MKKIIFIISILFFLTNKSFGQSERWIYLGEGNGKNGVTHSVYIDAYSISFKDNDVNTFVCWTKWVFNGHDKINYKMAYDEINCQEKSIKYIRTFFYMLDGSFKEFEINEKTFPPPESLGETMVNYFCGKYK